MTLAELADFFEQNPNAWCQEAGARDSVGNSVNPESGYAVQWCIWGCTKKFDVSYFDLHEKIDGPVTHWNDTPGRTVQDVIAMLRK